MNTKERILHAIQEFVARNPQTNLDSITSQENIAEIVYLAVMKRPYEGTYNEQQLEIFTNLDACEDK